MGEGLDSIYSNLASFRKKYYLNLFIRGSILTGSLILVYLIIAALLEHNLWMSKGARLLVFTSFFLLVSFCLYRFLKLPILWWIYKRGLDQEQSARIIGSHFPSINDRLLNLIQLAVLPAQNELMKAGIAQKSRSMSGIAFESAIDLRDNRRYIKYFAFPFLLIAALWIIDQRIFTQSTRRIVQFNQEFSPEAPFLFQVTNEKLIAFFNEDFTLSVRTTGESIPDALYISSGQQRLKMEAVSAGEFVYTFERLQNPMTFQLEGAGFYSTPYSLELINRPELTRLKIDLSFPRYLARRAEQLTNTGNIEIPEGTKATWTIGTSNAKTAIIAFGSAAGEPMQQTDDQSFTFGKNFFNQEDYSITMENEHARNKDRVAYTVRVIKDQHPEIVVDHVRDSVLFKTILLGGTVGDDYGLTDLQLRYSIIRSGREAGGEKVLPLALTGGSNQQSFFYKWVLDSVRLEAGDQLNYFLQVWDNDGVNGHKSTKSAMYTFSLPGQEEMKAEISKSQSATEGKIDKGLNKARDLRESIEQAQQKLKGKQSIDWQERKMLEDLIQQKLSLDQAIMELQKENQLLEEKKNALSAEENEKIREKSEQIQKLMDELLDEETKKLFEELQKLLKENADPSQIQKMLEKMDRKEINLEKELERTLELFKQLQLEYKIDQAVEEIKEQVKKQEELLKETEGDKARDQKDGQKPEQEKPDKESQKDTGKDSKEGEKESKEGDKESKDGDQKDGQKDEKTGEKEDGKEQADGDRDQQQDGNEEKSLSEKQEELSEDFEKFEETIDEIEKLGEELEQESDTPSQEDMDEVKDSQQQSKESLQNGNNQKAAQQQKKALQKMKQMQQSMEGMQSSMQMEIDMQNLESLRQIIHGLIKLSFDQENLMKEFAPVQQTDPKYVQLGQDQLKIQDDAKILEDSLLALAKKDAFMGSVVTREVGELNSHMEKAVESIRERKKGNAGSEMQLSMTSINNLALMLNDHFDMMMQMMANAMPGAGKKGKQKGKSQMNLGEMQQQLNQRIEQLRNGGKGGRELSEELARMAAEQERIRRALQEMQEQLRREGGKVPGGDLPGKMEQTEMDLVNKQITEQTIRRQQEIMTRLLETEKSLREQNMDNERKGETAKDYEKEIPRAFEEYLRLREKEVELLRTVPPKLYPYYKKEVNDYFKRIGTED